MCTRVTVVIPVCGSVCVLSHISPLECVFILKILSRTQWATKVKIFVGFLPKAICLFGHFLAQSAHTHYSIKGHEYPEC